jgi:hypothetical protein
MNLVKQLVPQQKTGQKTGATSKLKAPTRHAALVLFAESKSRLLDINNWQKLCGNKGAEFQLTDENGIHLNTKKPETGNLIKIKLPAPANQNGDGYDWVRIEKFESAKDLIKDEELFGFRVRPVSNPNNRTSGSAHFYTNEASSTFLIYRISSVVYAMELGRNEKPNPTGSLLNKIRNFAIAIVAMLGLSKPQWKSLTDGILRPPFAIV